MDMKPDEQLRDASVLLSLIVEEMLSVNRVYQLKYPLNLDVGMRLTTLKLVAFNTLTTIIKRLQRTQQKILLIFS